MLRRRLNQLVGPHIASVLQSLGVNPEAVPRRVSHLISLADFQAPPSAPSADTGQGRWHRGAGPQGLGPLRQYSVEPYSSSDDEEAANASEGPQSSQRDDNNSKLLKAAAKDPWRAAVEASMLRGDWWKRHKLVRDERPQLQQLLAAPEFISLVQATGGDQGMLDMLVEATQSDAAVACWRQKKAAAAQCASIIETEWQKAVRDQRVVEKLEEGEGGPRALARRLLLQLSGVDLPRLTPHIALQHLQAALDPEARGAEGRPEAHTRRPLPPFVVTQVAMRLAPPLTPASSGDITIAAATLPRKIKHHSIKYNKKQYKNTTSPTKEVNNAPENSAPGPYSPLLLDGWNLILPQLWHRGHLGPTLMEMVAATERLRAAALQEAAALAMSSPDGPDGLIPYPPPASSLFAQVQRQFTGEEPDLPESQPVIGSRRARRIAETIASTAKPVLQTAEERVTQRSGSRSAKGADDLSLPALDGKPVVLSIAELYPGSVGPEALLEKLVEVRPLRISRDWQPLLRPTRFREGFFFNPDAGRNAPTLQPEWGFGPSMAAVDPLVPYKDSDPLLQAPLLDTNFVSMLKGMDKEGALRRARATVRVCRRWATRSEEPGRPVLFYITAQGGYDIRTQRKVRQSIMQFYRRGREVVSGLLNKHSFDTVFVYMTSHYLDTMENWVLTHVKAKDLIVIQGVPGAVRAPVAPAPPWTAVPYAPHGRTSKFGAPEAPGQEDLLAGLEAYQPALRDAPSLNRRFHAATKLFGSKQPQNPKLYKRTPP